jgi:hypothetical protein
MKKYTQIYFDALNYHETDFIPSELSGHKAVDINHIICRGMGGTKDKDRIENLMALTRREHDDYGDKKHMTALLLMAHRKFLDKKKVEYDNDWFERHILRYAD